MKTKLLYIFLLIYGVGFSQSNKIKVEIDTTNIRIGEQFQYKISVDETENVILPKLNNLKGLEVIDTLKIDTVKNKLIQKYILTGFDSGAFYIPQQQVFIKNQPYLTDSLLINVATVAIDTTKIKKFPIKGIKGEAYQFDDFKNYFWWALAILIVIGLLLYFFVIKKKKEAEEEIIVPLLPPYEEAIEKLQELDKKLLWQNNKIKKYYSELTEIVRGYIERDIEISTQEITTNEIIDLVYLQNDAKNLNIDNETIIGLNKLLKNADLVKFAKNKPLANDIEFDRKTAEQIISKIQPKIVEYRTNLITVEKDQSPQPKKDSSRSNLNKTKKSLSKKYVFISSFIVAFIIFGYYGITVGRKTFNSVSKILDTSTTKMLYNKDWKTYSVGSNSIFSIQTPVELTKEKTPELPEEVEKYVNSIEILGYTSIVNSLQIIVMSTEYIPEIKADLNGAINSAIAQMQQQPNISNVLYDVQSYDYESIHGSKITGTFTENSINKIYEAFTFVNNNNMYLLIIAHKEGDSYGDKISNRVSKSIKISEKNVE